MLPQPIWLWKVMLAGIIWFCFCSVVFVLISSGGGGGGEGVVDE